MRVCVQFDCLLACRLLAPCCWVVHNESVYLFVHWIVVMRKKASKIFLMPFLVLCYLVKRNYFSIKISMIVLADLATGEPGPKIAATPALYKKS